MHFKPSSTVPELIRPVAEWLYSEWGCHYPNRSINTTELALQRAPNSEGLPSTVIAVEGQEPVGVARLVESDLEARPDLGPWLASVYVAEHKRNQGIGSSLCTEVLEIAKRHGYTTLYLFTPDRASFYERQGWSTMGHEQHLGAQVTLMKFELNEQGG